MGKIDRLLARYWRIRDDHGNGHATPILWHLALRGETSAMVLLAQAFASPGRLADPFSQSGLCYRAFRKGDPTAAQNLAVDAFNRGNLARYRFWIARAAALGDVDAAQELRRFELRLPHAKAGLSGRKRPEYRGRLR